ncbi:hypothetical protein B9K06_26130, partial [Bacillus sp. OG2]
METITSCSDNKCTATTRTKTYEQETKTENLDTTYTESTLTETITSCSDNKCTASTIVGVLSTITTTVGETVSTYTTVCPLTIASAFLNKTVTIGTSTSTITTS